ncbi:hypothetical protein BBM13_11900 [Vibrio parahaemolyticus]|uniref:hypothetical protein n=1 Tax=Vibrio harveyi group TaxID=717610 RepID=UPI0008131B74|nr:hypothetical protein [Vibrio parahaemolyticus]EGQ8231934.1 hypothetical protein [Vibrio parahaemolyticus]OCP67481.1 hypothetical protein AKH08_19395 [Vibrio parahaemolyticus]ODX82647.1 hypothetical protein BBM12_01500 [Vibrio parahaemolyticus]ODX85352.1 hypothetical protein BBM93_12935 [Vibrio parahaemolyticus]ODX88681.1 hypothetical protein BBM13_11900 [Vibrio parahaemolyticus]
MNKRQKNYHATKKLFREALVRLVTGEVTNVELRSRKIIQINPYTVEIEAEKSNGSIGRHPDVKKQIEVVADMIENGIKVTDEVLKAIIAGLPIDTNESVSISPVNVKNTNTYKKIHKRYTTANKRRKYFEMKYEKVQEELRRKDRELNDEIATRDEMFAALWNALPSNLVGERITAMKRLADVVNIQDAKREKEREDAAKANIEIDDKEKNK